LISAWQVLVKKAKTMNQADVSSCPSENSAANLWQEIHNGPRDSLCGWQSLNAASESLQEW
jgi:hypothetical protein